MNRRNFLALAAAAVPGTAAKYATTKATQVHVEIDVDPTRETELRSNFEKIFRPAISRQSGFVDVKLLKLRSAIAGPMPADVNYRMILSFETEAQREAWVKTSDHDRAWPTIAKTFRASRGALLYDVV